MAYDPYSKTNQYLIDGSIIGLTFYLAYQTRFEGAVPAAYTFQFWVLLPVLVVGRLALNRLLGIYRHMWRYVSIEDAVHLSQTYMAMSGLLVALRLGVPDRWSDFRVPLGVIALEFSLSLLGALSVRALRRVVYQRRTHSAQASQAKQRVVLLGAGADGVMTAKEILLRPDRTLVGFLDDDPRKLGAVISGIPVLGTLDLLPQVVREYQVREVIVCFPSAPREVLKRIWRHCEGLDVRTLIIPSLGEMIDGNVRVHSLRQITMEDLLGREALTHAGNEQELSRLYSGKRILLTGAGGSIGSELARQLATFGPGQLLLMDKDENGLYELQLDLAARAPKLRFELLVGDIRSVPRVRNICESFRPEIIFHAAAHKHVPLMESNPGEAVLNNVFGTKNLVDQAISCGVSLVILISSDKAVRPSSLMGASKRLTELLVQNQGYQSKTRFCAVRFGNVMSSRGSVIPLFQRQIEAGQPITLTDPQVSRYFMTIAEAVQLVIQVGLLDGDSGSIYLLDMGDPMRIGDLARDLIELSGLRPDHDIRIEIVGLRPGEKLREELVGDGESLVRTAHPKISVISSDNRPEIRQLEALLGPLREAAEGDDVEQIYRLLGELNIGFRPVSPESEALEAGREAPGA